MTKLGQVVRKDGVEWRVVDIHSYAGNGARGFGKYRFTLRAADGSTATAFGKQVTANSRLTPVDGSRAGA